MKTAVQAYAVPARPDRGGNRSCCGGSAGSDRDTMRPPAPVTFGRVSELPADADQRLIVHLPAGEVTSAALDRLNSHRPRALGVAFA
jgi:hypothetical protein